MHIRHDLFFRPPGKGSLKRFHLLFPVSEVSVQADPPLLTLFEGRGKGIPVIFPLRFAADGPDVGQGLVKGMVPPESLEPRLSLGDRLPEVVEFLSQKVDPDPAGHLTLVLPRRLV